MGSSVPRSHTVEFVQEDDEDDIECTICKRCNESLGQGALYSDLEPKSSEDGCEEA